MFYLLSFVPNKCLQITENIYHAYTIYYICCPHDGLPICARLYRNRSKLSIQLRVLQRSLFCSVWLLLASLKRLIFFVRCYIITAATSVTRVSASCCSSFFLFFFFKIMMVLLIFMIIIIIIIIALVDTYIKFI